MVIGKINTDKNGYTVLIDLKNRNQVKRHLDKLRGMSHNINYKGDITADRKFWGNIFVDGYVWGFNYVGD